MSNLSAATLGGYTAQLKKIGVNLNAGGNLLIYGCDVAQGVNGQHLMTDLSLLLRLDVPASTNRTGSSGDWGPEAAVVQIDLPEPTLADESGQANPGPKVAVTLLRRLIAGEAARALTNGLNVSPESLSRRPVQTPENPPMQHLVVAMLVP